MKYSLAGLLILLPLFISANVSLAQTDALYVVSYDDTTESSYFCNGVRQNYLQFYFYLGDLNQDPSDSNFTLDSLVLSGDTSIFQCDSAKFTNYLVGSGSAQGGFYVPKKVGDDTLRITGYYGGNSAYGMMIFHSIESPEVALLGSFDRRKTIISVGDFSALTQLNNQLVEDTLHDRFEPFDFYASDRPQYHSFNKAITISSCGDAMLISIDTVGDCSEITVDSIPSLPYTLQGGSNLVMPYTFIPHVVGNTHHFLRFHFAGGKTLIWSFEYQVDPESSVSQAANAVYGIRIFPNPASDELKIIGGVIGTARLFDLLGRERMDVNDDGSGASLDVSHLESGIYFLRLGNQSAKVEIGR